MCITKLRSPAISVRMHVLFKLFKKYLVFSCQACFCSDFIILLQGFFSDIRITLFHSDFGIHNYIQILFNETSFAIKMSKELKNNSLDFPLWRQLMLLNWMLFHTLHCSFKNSIITFSWEFSGYLKSFMWNQNKQQRQQNVLTGWIKGFTVQISSFVSFKINVKKEVSLWHYLYCWPSHYGYFHLLSVVFMDMLANNTWMLQMQYRERESYWFLWIYSSLF